MSRGWWPTPGVIVFEIPLVCALRRRPERRSGHAQLVSGLRAVGVDSSRRQPHLLSVDGQARADNGAGRAHRGGRHRYGPARQDDRRSGPTDDVADRRESVTETQILTGQDVALTDPAAFSCRDVPVDDVGDRHQVGATGRGGPESATLGLDEHRAGDAVDVARPDDDRRVDRHGGQARGDRAARLAFGELLAVLVGEAAGMHVELVGLGELSPGCRYAQRGERAGEDQPLHTRAQCGGRHVACPLDVGAVETFRPAVPPVVGDRRGVEDPDAVGHHGSERVSIVKHVADTHLILQPVQRRRR
jgi:hypothetical protein